MNPKKPPKTLLALLLSLLLLLSAAPLGIPAGYTAITSIAELNAVRGNLAGKYYLMADLDLSGQAWAPIGQAGAPFTGVFDGNGFAIRNLKAESGQAAGLFGQASGGVVENLSLVNCEIKATSGAAGGIAGVAANAAIRHCAVTGSVAGKTAAGGIVGQACQPKLIRYFLSRLSRRPHCKYFVFYHSDVRVFPWHISYPLL